MRVGHGDHGGHPARSSGTAGRGQSLAVFMAGFADKGAQIDQAGGHHHAFGINHHGPFGRSVDTGAEGGNHTVLKGNCAVFGLAAGRINQSGIADQNGFRVHRQPPFGKWAASASRIAMRTATPISTCSRISDCAPSAISEAISTPRFIGPGCITSASGLA